MLWHQCNRKEIRIGKRDRPMLHLAAWIALGVQIRDLFELERALKSERIENIATDKEKAVSVQIVLTHAVNFILQAVFDL